MYGYGYPPPYWGPPPANGGNLDHNTLEKGIRIAQKIAARDHREAERLANRMKKDKEDERKRLQAARSSTFFAIEWFIIGVIAYPIVGPLYQLLIHRVTQ